MSVFSEKLKELRAEKGLSQRLLANILNIAIPTLSHWECGYQEPSFKDLLNLATYFEVSTDYLLGLEDDFGARTTAPMSAPAPRSELSEKEKALLEAFKKLLPETQDFLLRTAESLSDSDRKKV